MYANERHKLVATLILKRQICLHDQKRAFDALHVLLLYWACAASFKLMRKDL